MPTNNATSIEKGRIRISTVLGLWFLSPIVVNASDPASDFRFDPVEHWAARILTWALVAAAVLAAYALVAVIRGELNGIAGRSIMAVGVVILPSFSVATGMLLVFVRAGSVEFCASCHHVMQDYEDDMKNPEGTGIAAVHYSNQYIPGNQCYECHTSYGLFGTFEAKIHGIGEVYRYYTHTYDLPIEMWHPYSNRDCLKCHASSRKWLAVDAHTDEDAQDSLFNDRTSCMSCHESGHNVRDAARGEAS
jgi:nitrate/TMAO reductase-like tetraheme cytochrome c subunit